jgi:hypothetical protein
VNAPAMPGYATVVSTATPDPDLPGQPEEPDEAEYESLRTDELRPETEATEYEPPDEPSPDLADPRTPADEQAGETLDERIAQEEPDPQASEGM